MHKHLSGRDEEFKKILLNEERYSTKTCYVNPIDLESSYLGWQINTLMNLLAHHDSLTAYTPVSVRVIMSIADLLMSFYHCHSYNLLKNLMQPDDCKKKDFPFPAWIEKFVISGRDKKEKKIAQKQQHIIERRHRLEKEFLVDRPLQYLSKMDDEKKHMHHQAHSKFTKSNGA
jgi:hypothetical protein